MASHASERSAVPDPEPLKAWLEKRGDLLVVLALLSALALFMARERTIAGAPGFPLDDSWIHLHFARNIAEGTGFSYNAGTPVAGSTAPLWTLLLAAGATLCGASPMLAKVIGAGATLGAALTMRRLALAWRVPEPVALVSAVALVLAGPVVWGALSGMEVPLAAFLVASALLTHARGRLFPTAVLAALAALARPEAFLLIPMLVLAEPLTVRRLSTFVAVAAVVLAPSVWFSLETVGVPLPATAAAKIEGGLIGWISGVHESALRTWIQRPWAFLAAWIRWLASTHWVLPLAIVPGIAVAWRRRGRALGVPALALLVHPLGMALLAPYRDPSFQEGRYSIHLLPVALVLLAVAIAEMSPRRRFAILLGYLVLALVTLPAAADRYAWAVQNINAMQVHLGRWVDGNLPRRARLAVNDIGAIAYFSRREVIDLMGLVSPDIIPYRRHGERGLIQYLRETCPDYVIVFPTWFPELVARPNMLEPIYRVRLERNEVSGGPEMVVYRLARCTV